MIVGILRNTIVSGYYFIKITYGIFKVVLLIVGVTQQIIISIIPLASFAFVIV